MGLKDKILDFVHLCVYVGAIAGIFALLFSAYAASIILLCTAWGLNAHFKRWCLGFYKDGREMAATIHIYSEKPKDWQKQEEAIEVEWELIGTSEENR